MNSKLKYLIFLFIVSFLCIINVNASELNSLKIKDYNLVPNFNKNIFKYNLYVNELQEKIDVNYKCDNTPRYLSYDLKEGKNIMNLTCDEENFYTLKIFRGKKTGESGLEELIIFGHKIDFKKDKYEYDIDVEENESNLDIDYKLDNDTDLINIKGNGGFNSGNNVVTIKVFNETDEVEYRINVNKAQIVAKELSGTLANRPALSTTENIMSIVVLITLGMTIILFIIRKMFKKKTA